MSEQLATSIEPTPDSHDAVISDALSVIDEALGKMLHREVLSSDEVADVLLDVRTALTATTEKVGS